MSQQIINKYVSRSYYQQDTVMHVALNDSKTPNHSILHRYGGLTSAFNQFYSRAIAVPVNMGSKL